MIRKPKTYNIPFDPKQFTDAIYNPTYEFENDFGNGLIDDRDLRTFEMIEENSEDKKK